MLDWQFVRNGRRLVKKERKILQSTEFFWRVVILLRYVHCPGPWGKFLKILTEPFSTKGWSTDYDIRGGWVILCRQIPNGGKFRINWKMMTVAHVWTSLTGWRFFRFEHIGTVTIVKSCLLEQWLLFNVLVSLLVTATYKSAGIWCLDQMMT